MREPVGIRAALVLFRAPEKRLAVVMPKEHLDRRSPPDKIHLLVVEKVVFSKEDLVILIEKAWEADFNEGIGLDYD